MTPEELENNGFEISRTDLFETLLTYVISNQLTTSEILRRQIELKELIINSKTKDDIVGTELKELIALIAEQANNQKNEIIAKLYSNKKD